MICGIGLFDREIQNSDIVSESHGCSPAQSFESGGILVPKVCNTIIGVKFKSIIPK
jgi:hypothetical protein